MNNIKKSILLPYSCKQMYDLVTHVADYPKFLPWCSHVDIFEQDAHTTNAKMHINFKGIKQFFHTHNTQQPYERIDMNFIDGPFKHFKGHWIFKQISHNACKIEFCLEYEFNSKIIEKIIGPVFQIITSTFVDCFVKQAKQIYQPILSSSIPTFTNTLNNSSK
jgi:ribosome-associated toxin RatA of RatAB toxin-antitoxin module